MERRGQNTVKVQYVAKKSSYLRIKKYDLPG